MDGNLIGGIAGAVGNVVGGLLNTGINTYATKKQQERQYEYEKKLQESQYGYNQKLAEQQQGYTNQNMATSQKYALESAKIQQDYAKEANEWARQNTKDSIGLKMQGMREANVNPIIGLNGEQLVQGAQGAQVGSAGAQAGGSAGGVGQGSVGLPNVDFSGIGNGIAGAANAYRAYLENEMLEAKIKKTEGETSLNTESSKLVEAQTQNVLKNNEYINEQINNLSAKTRGEIENIVKTQGGWLAEKLGTSMYLSLIENHPDATDAYKIIKELGGTIGSGIAGGILTGIGFSKFKKVWEGAKRISQNNSIKNFMKRFK